MSLCQASAGSTGPHISSASPMGERLAWLAVACLIGALLLVRAGLAPDQAILFANPLALALFAAFYTLIRIREAAGRL